MTHSSSNPPWFSSLEITLLWVGEFKPSVIFRLINNSLTDLTPEQRERIKQLKVEARREERALTETMERIQESLASPPILNLVRRYGRLIGGEVSEIEAAVDMLKTALLAVMESADALRGSTVANVVEVLSPTEAVRFFAAAAEFQLRMRRLGQHKDAERSC
ncbi:hypothetical protein P3X46_021176 [Hevea brasiliensis]|uniref:DOG1 domain-containing protein n=1 Tax=Hevea brasiliensis TaxID=3981 RepID=A0ABQ9LEN6_HEVBR|nr:hypothetical protein P3X46_021176 [Hevea brasiliensis]